MLLSELVVGDTFRFAGDRSSLAQIASLEPCNSRKAHAHINGPHCYWLGTNVEGIQSSNRTQDQATTFTPMSKAESSAIGVSVPAPRTSQAGKKARGTVARGVVTRFPVSVSYQKPSPQILPSDPIEVLIHG